MRCDTPVYFQTVRYAFDAVTGDSEPEIVKEVLQYARVTDSGVKTLNLIYGSIKQGSKVVRLQQPYTEPFDRIRIGDKLYKVDMSRKPISKCILNVSEVQ